MRRSLAWHSSRVKEAIHSILLATARDNEIEIPEVRILTIKTHIQQQIIVHKQTIEKATSRNTPITAHHDDMMPMGIMGKSSNCVSYRANL